MIEFEGFARIDLLENSISLVCRRVLAYHLRTRANLLHIAQCIPGGSHVSELEPSASRSVDNNPRPARTEDVLSFVGDEPAAEREGLPREYRMRADAHYIDQLESRHDGPPIRLIPTRQIDNGEPASVAALEPLILSISAHGMLQPLLVRRQTGRAPGDRRSQEAGCGDRGRSHRGAVPDPRRRRHTGSRAGPCRERAPFAFS